MAETGNDSDNSTSSGSPYRDPNVDVEGSRAIMNSLGGRRTEGVVQTEVDLALDRLTLDGSSERRDGEEAALRRRTEGIQQTILDLALDNKTVDGYAERHAGEEVVSVEEHLVYVSDSTESDSDEVPKDDRDNGNDQQDETSDSSEEDSEDERDDADKRDDEDEDEEDDEDDGGDPEAEAETTIRITMKERGTRRWKETRTRGGKAMTGRTSKTGKTTMAITTMIIMTTAGPREPLLMRVRELPDIAS